MLKKLITISITAIASLQAATTYNKSLTDGNDDLNYWSDTTSSNLTNHTLVGATEVFTIGSRKNIPNVPTTSIKVSTNKLCSDDRKGLVSCSKSDSLEPRYTDDGLATSGESNLRTWYKATTPKSVNGVVDDPCVTLLNTGSVVNWWSDFVNLRCERTVTTYTPKVNSNIYTNKVNSNIFANKLTYTTTGVIGGGHAKQSKYNSISSKIACYSTNGDAWCRDGITAVGLGNTGAGYSCTTGTRIILSNSTNTDKWWSCNGSFTTSTCPSGYVDNGANCKQTIQICPDASWSSATATTCSKVIQICPDASWTDNGTNCKKNVPEYKLFSTF